MQKATGREENQSKSFATSVLHRWSQMQREIKQFGFDLIVSFTDLKFYIAMRHGINIHWLDCDKFLA